MNTKNVREQVQFYHCISRSLDLTANEFVRSVNLVSSVNGSAMKRLGEDVQIFVNLRSFQPRLKPIDTSSIPDHPTLVEFVLLVTRYEVAEFGVVGVSISDEFEIDDSGRLILARHSGDTIVFNFSTDAVEFVDLTNDNQTFILAPNIESFFDIMFSLLQLQWTNTLYKLVNTEEDEEEDEWRYEIATYVIRSFGRSSHPRELANLLLGT